MCFLLAVVVSDFRHQRIPNVLNLVALLAALAVQSTAGIGGLMTGLAGAAVGLAVFLPFYAFGGMGAGDVKAMAAAGSFLGPLGAFLAGCLALVAGFGFAMYLFMIRVGSIQLPWQRFAWNSKGADTQRPGFPYAGAIAVGCVITLWYLERLAPLA